QFCDTWYRLPLGPRREILRHWRTRAGLPSQFTRPLNPSLWWVQNEIGNIGAFASRDTGPHATSSQLGHLILFNARTFARLPDQASRYVIAHELAHVLQWIAGAIRENEALLEVDADRLAVEWGFWNPAQFEEWQQEEAMRDLLGEFARALTTKIAK